MEYVFSFHQLVLFDRDGTSPYFGNYIPHFTFPTRATEPDCDGGLLAGLKVEAGRPAYTPLSTPLNPVLDGRPEGCHSSFVWFGRITWPSASILPYSGWWPMWEVAHGVTRAWEMMTGCPASILPPVWMIANVTARPRCCQGLGNGN